MTNDIDIKLIGDDELLKIVRALDKQTEHRVLKKVVSNAANIYVKAAKKNIPVRKTKIAPLSVMPGKKRKTYKWHTPGTGKKSPKKKVSRNKSNATVFVGPAGEKGTRTDIFYLRFWERGTQKMQGRWGFRRAYEANERKVDETMFKSMRTIMEREIKKFAKRS